MTRSDFDNLKPLSECPEQMTQPSTEQTETILIAGGNGNVDLPMDRWFGSFNDGSTAATKRLLRQGRKQGQSNQ